MLLLCITHIVSWHVLPTKIQCLGRTQLSGTTAVHRCDMVGPGGKVAALPNHDRLALQGPPGAYNYIALLLLPLLLPLLLLLLLVLLLVLLLLLWLSLYIRHTP
jgi:hypothetical protein